MYAEPQSIELPLIAGPEHAVRANPIGRLPEQIVRPPGGETVSTISTARRSPWFTQGQFWIVHCMPTPAPADPLSRGA